MAAISLATTSTAARSSLLRRRFFCAAAFRRGAAPKYDDRVLWVSYADMATMRRRLVGTAQQVRGRLDEPLPELRFPSGEYRVRHGFWFMRFERPELVHVARSKFDGTPFVSACGSLRGTLQLDSGDKSPLDLRAMLNVTATTTDPVIEWLSATFSPYGRIARVRTPRVKNNWDQGFGFVEFEEADAAEAALESLDGTPSLVEGCRMFVDFAKASQGEPLMQLRPPPILPPRRRPRHELDALTERERSMS